jgi:hypothetical protein
MKPCELFLLAMFIIPSPMSAAESVIVPVMAAPAGIKNHNYLVKSKEISAYIQLFGGYEFGKSDLIGTPARIAEYDEKRHLICFYEATLLYIGLQWRIIAKPNSCWGPKAQDFAPDSFAWNWDDIEKRPVDCVAIYDEFNTSSRGTIIKSNVTDDEVFSALLKNDVPPKEIPEK